MWLQHTGSSFDDVIVTVETTFSQFVGGYVADLMLCEFDSGKEYKNLHTIEVHTKLRGQGSGKEGANEQKWNPDLYKKIYMTTYTIAH